MPRKPDPQGAYTTYSNYSLALARLLTSLYPTPDDLARAITSTTAFASMAPSPASPSDKFDRALHMAWDTETLLLKQMLHHDLLPHSIPWNLVQRYYAIHQLTRAYFIATDPSIKRWHSDTLRAINVHMEASGDLFPPPWRALAKGYGPFGTLHTCNISPALPAPLTNAFFNPDSVDPWQYFALLLKTTQERRVRDLAEKWKAENGAKTIANPKLQALMNRHVQSSSVFDFFCRMRLRSNYQDVDLILVPYTDEASLGAWQEAIALSLSYSALLLECLIANAVGKKRYQEALKTSRPHTVTIGRTPSNPAQQRWDSCLQAYL
jgi:hypothetical protein